MMKASPPNEQRSRRTLSWRTSLHLRQPLQETLPWLRLTARCAVADAPVLLLSLPTPPPLRHPTHDGPGVYCPQAHIGCLATYPG